MTLSDRWHLYVCCHLTGTLGSWLAWWVCERLTNRENRQVRNMLVQEALRKGVITMKKVYSWPEPEECANCFATALFCCEGCDTPLCARCDKNGSHEKQSGCPDGLGRRA